MLTVTAPDPLNGARLRDELAQSGVNVDVEGVTLADGELTFPGLDEADRAAVEQVIAAHTGAATDEQQAKAAARQGVLDAFARLDQIANFQGTATNAQLSDAVRDLARYIKHLAKLHADELLDQD